MKRPRCKKCKHTMKGHKKQKCQTIKLVILADGSKYIGSVYDDKPSGHGILEGDDYIYEGYFLNGKYHGKGQETLHSGQTYNGDWIKGKKHGDGELITNTGSKYVGSFKNNKYHGFGTMIHSDSSYEGEWHHGTYHGYGTHKTHIGTYKGDFYFNVRHGKGTFTDNCGNTYTGHWKRGLRDGQGVYQNADETYIGTWSNDLQSGYGKWVSKRHGTYIGQFKHGKRHRKGSQTWPDGTIYEGGWSKGKRTGHGTIKWTDGSKYVGFWLKDEYNGSGSLMLKDDSTFKGEWEHGRREGIFTEIKIDGQLSVGPWSNDLRHGTFKDNNHKILYIWNTKVEFESLEDAKRACKKMMKVHDYEGSRVILEFYKKLRTWSFISKYDKRGIHIHMLENKQIVNALKKYAYKLFKQKRYTFLEHLMKECPENALTIVSEKCEELFDSLSNTFVPNPWMVKNQSYSEETKHKLLSGIFLGEFGRCPPKDPYTRLPLTEEAGSYLNKHPKKAKEIYHRFMKAINKEPPIREIARSFDVQDFEELLKNAREAGDRQTIKRIMKERNEYIQQH